MEFVQTCRLSGRFISFPTTLTSIVPVCDWGDDLWHIYKHNWIIWPWTEILYQTRSAFKKSCNCILYIEYCTYWYGVLKKRYLEQEKDRKKLCWCLTYQYVQLLIIIISIFPNTIFLCIDCNIILYIKYIFKCCARKNIERDTCTVSKREKQTI